MLLKKPIRKPGLALKSSPSLSGKKTLGALKPAKAKTGFGSMPASGKVKSGGAFAKARQETTLYEERRNQAFRVSVPVGGHLEVYLLDRGEPFTRYEHNIGGGPNSRGTIVPCIKDTGENCPACAKENKEGAFVMLCTAVIPSSTWKSKSGEAVTRKFQKQLFPIKIKMTKKYERLFTQHGTFRGMVLKLYRDNKMDAGTGSDVEFIRMMSEAEIQKYAKNPPIKDPEKKAAAIKQDLAEPFDYEKMMPQPDAKKLAAMVGAAFNSAGSKDFSADDEEADEETATGWGDDEE